MKRYLTLILMSSLASLYALPSGEQVVEGDATTNRDKHHLSIHANGTVASYTIREK